MTALLLRPLAMSAEEPAPVQNPYLAVVSRNVFGLVPIPPPAPVEAAPIDPPPKITVNGLMRLFGTTYQVLFKTPGKAKPNQPAKEESYVMGEGERQNDIEVKKINPDSGVITFVNHGVLQECSLVVAQNTGSAPAAAGPGVLGVPGNPVPALTAGAPGGFGGRPFGRPVRPNKNVTTSADVAQQQATFGGGPGGFPPSDNPNAVNPESLSPEAQVILIEKNRLDTQAQVDAGTLPPLPPTPLTPSDATGSGGSPLIVPDSPTPPHQ